MDLKKLQTIFLCSAENISVEATQAAEQVMFLSCVCSELDCAGPLCIAATLMYDAGVTLAQEVERSSGNWSVRSTVF